MFNAWGTYGQVVSVNSEHEKCFKLGKCLKCSKSSPIKNALYWGNVQNVQCLGHLWPSGLIEQ
eukprot:1033958-Amphidinium_carterae.1